MKIERTLFFSNDYSPRPIATGVEGGGYVTIKSNGYGSGSLTSSISMESVFTRYNQMELKNEQEVTFYLNEGEVIYGQGSSTYTVYMTVIYHNSVPSSQNNNPLSFTGSINLSQN